MGDERKGGSFPAPRQPRYSRRTTNNLDLFFLNHPYIVLVIRRWERRLCRKKEYSSQLYSVRVGEPARKQAGKADRASKES